MEASHLQILNNGSDIQPPASQQPLVDCCSSFDPGSFQEDNTRGRFRWLDGFLVARNQASKPGEPEPTRAHSPGEPGFPSTWKIYEIPAAVGKLGL